MSVRTVKEWQQACRAMRPGGDSAIIALESDYFLAHCLGVSRAWLLAHADDDITTVQEQLIQSALVSFASDSPLSYVLRSAAFMGLPLSVTPDTLIPRADTECMVDWLLQQYSVSQPRSVIDLGTGSGAIAVSIAVARPSWQVSMSDQSAAALAVAAHNAEQHAVPVQAYVGSWWEPLADKRFDIVISNPPYIAADDPALAELTAEPSSALVSGEEGLADIVCILSSIDEHLEPGGCCLIEHGYQQGLAVRELFCNASLQAVMTHKDLAGRDRFTAGFKGEKVSD